MKCYNCGTTLGSDPVCQGCGIQIKVYKKLLTISNYCYNQGLERAKIRNLSGAAQMLRLALKYNKMNISARNLLGLVYYEMGEDAAAICEWIISKSLKPERNIAEEYLEKVQKNRTNLEHINQTARKYNQAIAYCRQGSDDLAVLQLKKVVSMNPRFVRGYQLLALLYIRSGEQAKAKEVLKKAALIDGDNTTTQRYLQETGVFQQEDQKEKGRKKEKKQQIVTHSGNETIIQPRTTFREFSPLTTVLNIIIGIVIGALVTGFLVVPGVQQSVKSEVSSAVSSAKDTITAKDDDIKSLNQEIEDLQGQIQSMEDEKVANDSRIAAYEQLLSAYIAYTEGDIETAGTSLGNVNVDYLSESAKVIYNDINGKVNEQYLETMYADGERAYNSYKYDESATALQAVVDVEEGYRDGYAVYYLAQSYRKIGNNEKALEYYRKIIELCPGTSRASTAQGYISQLEAEMQAAGTLPDVQDEEEGEDGQIPGVVQ